MCWKRVLCSITWEHAELPIELVPQWTVLQSPEHFSAVEGRVPIAITIGRVSMTMLYYPQSKYSRQNVLQ